MRILLLTALVAGLPAVAQTDIMPWLDANNVSWNVPGPGSAESMPLGNGDIGLNVWVETNGALNFYIAKTDAWNDNNWWAINNFEPVALLKLAGVRVSLNPNPFSSSTNFLQTLKLHEGEIQIQEGAATLRVWVDANHPVIRVEATSSNQPVSVSVSLNNWRLNATNPDRVLGGQTNRIEWFHRSSGTTNSYITNLTFGAVIKGAGLTNSTPTNLVSAAATSHLISIYPLTAQTATTNQWVSLLETQIGQIDALNLEQTRQAHRDWWDAFWHRSWVYVTGDTDATNVTRGYVLQRFITACAGRGAHPIKFNGTLFVVENPGAGYNNADGRDWGGQYWFQNTRAMYWPRMAAGDFDLMQPLFKMYLEQVPGNSAIVSNYYGHGGAYFAETAPFWGGLPYAGPEVAENWTLHYFVPVIELTMMMLDYYEFTGDTNFLQNTLLPVATAGLQFYDKHFSRDAQGKILLDPVNSIEQFWKVHDPAPDIAGLMAVLPRLLAITNQSDWARMVTEIPPLPVGTKNGQTVLLPYTGPQTATGRNSENPELYSIYPYRLYGVGKPDLPLAITTFNNRTYTYKGCWVQDPIQAAMLGLTAVAKDYLIYNFTNKEARLKFPAFWAKRNDYAPDEDNGGNGEHALQQMLMQTDGKKIQMLPAWPAGWNANFKLHAPFQTTVEGTVVNGILTNLIITPPERAADIFPALSPAQSLSFVQQPSTVGQGAAITPEVQVLAIGTNGVPLGNASITISLGSGSGTLAGTLTQYTDTNGIAHFANLSLNQPGSKTLTAIANGASTNSNPFNVIGSVAALAFTTQPGSAIAGQPFGQQPVLKTVDAFGVPSTVGLPASLMVYVSLTNGVGTLSGTTVFNIGTTGANGVMNFTDLAVDTAGSNLQLFATTALPASSNTIAGASLWLDAADLSTVTTNGIRVSAWKNKVNPASLTQATGTLQPWFTNSIAGKKVLTFSKNGAGYGTGCTFLGNVGLGAYTNGGNQMTYFLVARQTVASIGWQGPVSFSTSGQTDGQGSAGVVVLTDGSQGGFPLGIQRNHPATPMQATVALPALGTPFAMTYMDNAGTASLRIVEPTGAARSNTANIVNGISPYKYNVTDVTVGGRLEPSPTVDNGWDGDIAEVLVYNSALSSGDRAAVETYLTNKWFASSVAVTTSNALSAPFNVQSSTNNMPLQPDSILSITMDGNGSVGVSYATVSGSTYHVETTTDLVSSAWQTIPGSTTNATGNIIIFIDPNAATDPQRFYRIASP